MNELSGSLVIVTSKQVYGCGSPEDDTEELVPGMSGSYVTEMAIEKEDLVAPAGIT